MISRMRTTSRPQQRNDHRIRELVERSGDLTIAGGSRTRRPKTMGSTTLLLEPEQVLHDVSIGREQRRTQQGYLTPGDARPFSGWCGSRTCPGGTKSTNAIAAAYFRALDEAIEPAASTLAENAFELRRDGASTEAIAESMQAAAELLAEALTRSRARCWRPPGTRSGQSFPARTCRSGRRRR